MPTLTLRTVGMSYILEGIGPSGLDGGELHDALYARYGPAVAVLGTSASSPGNDEVAAAIDALLIDRKAAPVDALREAIRSWIEGRGCRYISWAEDPLSGGATSTLHFHV